MQWAHHFLHSGHQVQSLRVGYNSTKKLATQLHSLLSYYMTFDNAANASPVAQSKSFSTAYQFSSNRANNCSPGLAAPACCIPSAAHRCAQS